MHSWKPHTSCCYVFILSFRYFFFTEWLRGFAWQELCLVKSALPSVQSYPTKWKLLQQSYRNLKKPTFCNRSWILPLNPLLSQDQLVTINCCKRKSKMKFSSKYTTFENIQEKKIISSAPGISVCANLRATVTSAACCLYFILLLCWFAHQKKRKRKKKTQKLKVVSVLFFNSLNFFSQTPSRSSLFYFTF